MTHCCFRRSLCAAECILQAKSTFLNTLLSPGSYRVTQPSVDAGSLCSLLGLQGPQQNPTCKFLFHPFCKAALVIKKISLDFWLSLDWIKFNLWAKFGNLCHSVSSTIYLCLTIESIFSLFVTTMMGQWTKKRKQKPKAHSYPDNNNIPCTG